MPSSTHSIPPSTAVIPSGELPAITRARIAAQFRAAADRLDQGAPLSEAKTHSGIAVSTLAILSIREALAQRDREFSGPRIALGGGR